MLGVELGKDEGWAEGDVLGVDVGSALGRAEGL